MRKTYKPRYEVNYLNIYNHGQAEDMKIRGRESVFVLLKKMLSLIKISVAAFFLFIIQVTAQNSNCLTWAPPDTAGYTRITYQSGGTYTLNDNTNYVIIIGKNFDRTLRLDGGRNIVIIGGEFNITNGSLSNNDRMGIRIFDGANAFDGRIVHIEGVHVHGSSATEGIQISAPKVIIQIQNFRVSEIYGGQSLNHSDFVQPWGGCKEIRIDKLTGYSNYQGLFTNADYNGPLGPMYLKRVDMHDLNNQSKYFFWWDQGKTSQFFLDDNTVWVQPASSTPLGKTVWPDQGGSYPYQAQIATDATSEYAYWPDNANGATGKTAVRNFNNTARGIVRKGSPPGGNYVPASSVGMSYVSPGYLSNGSCGSTAPVASVNGATLCGTNCATLTASASNGTAPFTYVWTPNIGAGKGPHTVCPSVSAVYTVTVTDATGKTSTDTALVKKSTAGNINLGNDTTACTGSAINLDAGGGHSSYIWSVDDSLNYSLPSSNVTAIGYEAGSSNVPANVRDNNFSTRWSNLGIGSWITLDLGADYVISGADIAWYNVNRGNYFVISVSKDNLSFTDVYSGSSNDVYLPDYEPYIFSKKVYARYVKITVNGNSLNDWASITEIRIKGNKGASGQTTSADSSAEWIVDAYDVLGCHSSDTIQVSINVCTQLQEAVERSFSGIFPNPVVSYFSVLVSKEVALKAASMKIFSICGKDVKTISLEHRLTTTGREELQSGIYFYYIFSDNKKIASGKIIIL